MILTDEQRTVVREPGNLMVVACPGSGKTRTLIAKLRRCLEDVRGTSRRVACITYTNTAVNEIEERLRKSGAEGDEVYCDISTIHSFCVSNILRHFHWRIPEYRGGFTILPPDSDEYRELVDQVFDRYGLERSLKDRFELLNRGADGEPVISDPAILREAVHDFWKCLADRSAVDFPNIVYQSYRILANNPHVVRGLASRYRWVLVDEFQDTSDLQVKILRKIASFGVTEFFLVGDPFQSIFGFAGARPELMEVFADEIGARKDLPLSGNFRCSQGIVVSAETLLPREPPMTAVGRYATHVDTPMRLHSESCFAALRDTYLPAIRAQEIPYGAAAILAPWWTKLLPLARLLREQGVPIVGPGARPYRGIRLLASLVEQAGAYAESGDPRYVRPTERALFFLVENVGNGSGTRVFTHDGRRTACELLRRAETVRIETDSGVEWLRLVAREFSQILFEADLIPESARQQLVDSVADMESDMSRNGVDLEELRVADLGIYANPDANMKLMTLHGAKGREFDAVAIVDVHEGRVPHYTATSESEIEEGRRVFYVGVTRAKKLLVFVTDREHWRNQPSRFLREMGVL